VANEEAAFEILGKIEVDVAALKKSLNEAHGEVEKFATKYQQTLQKVSKPLPGGGVSEGGPGGLGPGGGGGEGGGHSGLAEFAHSARLAAHLLEPAMQGVNSAMAQFIQVGAQAARTAVFFGATIGAVAITGSIASEVISKYVEKAKEMAEANVNASRALAMWDFARVESGIKRVNEAMAA